MSLTIRGFYRSWGLCVLLAGGTWGYGQAPISPSPVDAPPVRSAVPSFSVEGGYLVAHLPKENVTVVAKVQASPVLGEDQGWASWTQRGEILWRGQMEDSQGRLYNIRILPGYVVPFRHGVEGWKDAASNISEYGNGSTWRKLGRNSSSCFAWGWKRSFWKFGIEGSGNAWSENLQNAGRRVRNRSFGWPLAYPWAVVSASFETLLRVPIGTVGAALGTVGGAVIVPAYRVAAPSVKAVYHAGIDGVVLPIAGWTWQTVAAPPSALLASAPSPSRADGTWMKLVEPRRQPEAVPAPRTLSGPSVEILARYAAEIAHQKAREAEDRRLERAEIEAVSARHLALRKQMNADGAVALQAWADDPANQQALRVLVEEGGDPDSIRAAREGLVQRLVAMHVTENQAREAVAALVWHPLRKAAPVSRPALNAGRTDSLDKTDPVKGALKTVDRVTGTKLLH